jgi:transcriptional regulator with XRE-family HTH domain
VGRREQPVRPGPLHEFATELRTLRMRTGLPYRALARKAGYSYSALSTAASGDALPTLEVTLAYVPGFHR